MKRLLLIISYITFIISAFAQQNISISTSAPKVVAEGEIFHVRYTINCKTDNLFSIESCNEIEAIGRPQTSSSSSISIINGKTTQSTSYTETRQFKATKKGTYTLPTASIKIEGKTYNSKKQQIEVVENNSPYAQQQQSSQQSYSQPQDQVVDQQPKTTSGDVFASVTVNKTAAYIGEPILATIKLYSNKRITDLNDCTYPDFNGFYKKTLEEPQQKELKEEKINGQTYYSVLFQRVVLFPQKDGKLTISPFKVDCNIVDSYYQDFFFSYPQITNKKVESKTITINVKSYPEGKDDNFNGAVGSFKITTSTSSDTIPANEAFTLKVTISGTGNLALIQKPNIVFPKDFEIYDPKESVNTTLTSSGDKGSKTFEYLIIPRHEGKFSIPEIYMQYLDLASKKFKSVRTNEIPITVTKGNAITNNSSTINYHPSSKEDVQISNDIHYLKTGDLHLQDYHNFFFKSRQYWLINGIIILGTLGFIVIRRKQIVRQSDTIGMKIRGANKVSQKRLKIAYKYLHTNDNVACYDEVAKALWGYVADKFAIEQIDLTTDKIKAKLVDRNINEELINTLIQIIQRCEFARFAPTANNDGKEMLYQDASNIIQEFEKIK